uniref:Uncharacterized protein n=1 Tax=Oryza nivara TaxID=4536 RepID=A0A0E0G920_ORYNI
MDRRTRYQTYEDSTESVGAGYILPGAHGPLVAQLRAPYRGQEVTIGGGALHLDQAVDAREIRMVQHEEDRIQVLPGFITELGHRRSAPRGVVSDTEIPVSVFTGKPHFPSSLQQRLSINCVLVFVSIQTAQAEARNLERAEREREREREKERARSAAMDEWEELAWRVPETLMLVSCEMEATRLIEVAHSNLQVRGTLFRRIHLGMPAAIAMNLFGDPAAEGVIPTEILEEARREISQSTVLHAKTRHVLARYVAHLGAQQDDPAYRSWDVHHQEAVDHISKALKRVIDTVLNAEAGKVALVIMGSVAYGCPQWDVWASEAEKFTAVAALEATMATNESSVCYYVAKALAHVTSPMHAGGRGGGGRRAHQDPSSLRWESSGDASRNLSSAMSELLALRDGSVNPSTRLGEIGLLGTSRSGTLEPKLHEAGKDVSVDGCRSNLDAILPLLDHPRVSLASRRSSSPPMITSRARSGMRSWAPRGPSAPGRMYPAPTDSVETSYA